MNLSGTKVEQSPHGIVVKVSVYAVPHTGRSLTAHGQQALVGHAKVRGKKGFSETL